MSASIQPLNQKESFALRDVQHSTPSEATDWMNVHQSTQFETTDSLQDSDVCPVCQNILYIFKPQTHITVSTKARNMYICWATSVFTNYLFWSLRNFKLSISKFISMQSLYFRFPNQTLVSISCLSYPCFTSGLTKSSSFCRPQLQPMMVRQLSGTTFKVPLSNLLYSETHEEFIPWGYPKFNDTVFAFSNCRPFQTSPYKYVPSNAL